MTSWKDAVVRVLSDANGAMSCDEIAEAVLALGLADPGHYTPSNRVARVIQRVMASDARRGRETFVRTGPGIYALASSNGEAGTRIPAGALPRTEQRSSRHSDIVPRTRGRDAAARWVAEILAVLRTHPCGLRAGQIARAVRDRGRLPAPHGSPTALVARLIESVIHRDRIRRDRPTFVRLAPGLYALHPLVRAYLAIAS